MISYKSASGGGSPFQPEDIEMLQEQWRTALAQMINPLAESVILSGVERTVSLGNSNFTEGYVFIAGEVCYFPAQSIPSGSLFEYISIVESNDPSGTVQYWNGTTQDNWLVKTAGIFGGASVPINSVDYNSVKTIIRAMIDAVHPTGSIIMWSGSPVDIPDGWALCNGSGGTPDLRGRFIVGYSGTGDYASIGATGGQLSHTLSESNLPVLSHDIIDPTHTHVINVITPGGALLVTNGTGTVQDGGSSPSIPAASAQAVTLNSASTGISITDHGSATPTPLNNRPPYYTLAYLIKI